ncbi:MAG: RNA polymerase sigma factor [Gaiellaceae bacterium]
MGGLTKSHPRLERSFERLYRRHVADVYRYSLAVLRDPEDAKNVTQTTFVNAYRAYGRGERPRTARTWLIAIAHSVCRQRFRQARRRLEGDALQESHAPERVAPSLGDVERALVHLDFNERAALVMRRLEGRSCAEIAQMLEVSTGAVEALVFRARRALREQLEGSLTCPEAERAISRRLDGHLRPVDRKRLRVHLRACAACAALTRRHRAQRAAIRALGAVPLPPSLASFAGRGVAQARGATKN